MKLTISEIEKIGYEARNNIPEPLGYCYRASKYIVDTLKNRYDLTSKQASIKEVRVGKSEIHFVAKLDARCVKNSTYPGSLLIDVTLDQYCDSNLRKNKNKDEPFVKTSRGTKESIKPVNIYEFDKSPYKNT